MTVEEEMRLLRLEKRCAELVAENLRIRKRADDLQRMHNADQRFIGKLQAEFRKSDRHRAEAVFK